MNEGGSGGKESVAAGDAWLSCCACVCRGLCVLRSRASLTVG